MSEYSVRFINENLTLRMEAGKSLLQAQIDAGLQPDAPCGGRGTCGKCLIKLRRNAQEEWQTVKSCQTFVNEDMEALTLTPDETAQILMDSYSAGGMDFDPQVRCVSIEVQPNRPGESVADWELTKSALEAATGIHDWQMNIGIASGLGELIRKHSGKLHAVVDGDRVLEISGEPMPAYMAAFDIGTTSIAGYLLRTENSEVLAREGMLNPQRQYGADIIMRADYALAHGVDKLSSCVRQAINEMLDQLCSAAGVDKGRVFGLSIVGNTCIHHLFLGIDPGSLVRAPYNPVISEGLILRAADFDICIHPEGTLRILPVIAGFVGADTVGCMVAENWNKLEPLTLLIDIGTNGEIVLGNKERMIACSTAAGPAFEGAKIECGMRGMRGAVDHVELVDGEVKYSVIGDVEPIGICGSGLIDLVATLRRAEEIDEYGHMESGTEYFLPGSKVKLTQKDVREVQLAKAAISAGIKLLSAQLGVTLDDIVQVHIAGAFGSYMNPDSACDIGLIPMELRPKIRSIGNAAGEGAKLVMQSRGAWRQAEALARQAEFLELASLPEFQDEFVDALEFPEL